MRPTSLLLVLAVLVSACAARTTGSPAASAPGEVPAVLEFEAVTAAGEPFDGTGLAGRPVVLWFWAPWCPTCRAQAPAVAALAEEHAGEVHVVGVGSLDQEEAVRAYAEQADFVTQLVDPDGAVWRHLAVTEQSTYLILDEYGTEIARGFLSNDDLAETVDGLVG